MQSKAVRYITGIIIFTLLFNGVCFPQTIKDPEAEYQMIRKTAFDGDLKSAAISARKLVNQYPAYGDARILLGRILSWQKNYDDALAVIDTLLASDPGNEDALSARRDIMVWSKDKSPASSDIRSGYTYDIFNEPFKRFWQVFSVGTGHKFDWGKGSVSVNAGHSVITGTEKESSTDFQLEADAYPKISAKNYAFLNYAISPGKKFPGHRATGEIWQVLPKGWAVSAGLNYYYFDRSNYIAAGSVEKYIGNYWLALKGFVYFRDNGPTTSGYFTVRGYFNDTDYLQFTASAGSAPDEPFDAAVDLERLSAYGVKMAYSGYITGKLSVRASMGYSIEEYSKSMRRNRYEGGISLFYSIAKTK
jgi:YaiO family outer membrane protein